MPSSSNNNPSEPWRNRERHYCALCNAWMGSDRQSILLHENGKKHRENVELNLRQRRLDKVRDEKDRAKLDASVAEMERIALEKHRRDMEGGSFGSASGASATVVAGSGVVGGGSAAGVIPSTALPTPVVPPGRTAGFAHASKSDGGVVNFAAKSDEMDSWHARKKRREEAAAAGRSKSGDGTTKPEDSGVHHHSIDTASAGARRRGAKRKLGDAEGHYTLDGTTYLEGPVYAPILEEDTPVQIWVGDESISETDRRGAERYKLLWKTGLVIRVHRKAGSRKEEDEEKISLNVSYLKSPDDEDETIEKDVDPKRIRLVLGSDETLPTTIEEARLTLLGGEEVVTVTGNDGAKPDIDENTGFSSWGTVSIRKVTVSKEVKEERARLRAKRRAEAEREKELEKEREGRKMEEAKHANADDSALGAYDVWSASGKGGYKGVNIEKETTLGVEETGKSLSKGKGAVGFKKRKGGSGCSTSLFKKGKKKQNRRTTSADDD